MTKEARNPKCQDRISVIRTLGFFSHSSFVILNGSC
jgi:hypothetical protein